MTTHDFDWTNDDAIIAEHQPALAVYTNPRGQAVIRQEAGPCDEYDAFIFVNRENIIGAAYALLDQAVDAFEITEQVGGGYRDVPRPERHRCEPEPEPEVEPERLALPAPAASPPQKDTRQPDFLEMAEGQST